MPKPHKTYPIENNVKILALGGLPDLSDSDFGKLDPLPHVLLSVCCQFFCQNTPLFAFYWKSGDFHNGEDLDSADRLNAFILLPSALFCNELQKSAQGGT